MVVFSTIGHCLVMSSFPTPPCPKDTLSPTVSDFCLSSYSNSVFYPSTLIPDPVYSHTTVIRPQYFSYLLLRQLIKRSFVNCDWLNRILYTGSVIRSTGFCTMDEISSKIRPNPLPFLLFNSSVIMSLPSMCDIIDNRHLCTFLSFGVPVYYYSFRLFFRQCIRPQCFLRCESHTYDNWYSLRRRGKRNPLTFFLLVKVWSHKSSFFKNLTTIDLSVRRCTSCISRRSTDLSRFCLIKTLLDESLVRSCVNVYISRFHCLVKY